MIKYLFTCLLLFLVVSVQGQSSSIRNLEARLKKSKSSEEKMKLYYELGAAYLRASSKKAEEYAYKAALAAREQGDNDLAAKAYFINALAKLKNGDRKGALARFKLSFQYAERAKDISLMLKALEEIVDLAKRNRDYKMAYEHTKDALEILSRDDFTTSSRTKRNSSSSLSNAKIAKENQELEAEKKKLQLEIARLKNEKNILYTDKSSLAKKQQQLEEEKSLIEAEKKEIEVELTRQEAQIDRMSEKQLRAEAKLMKQNKILQDLEIEKTRQQMVLQEQELALSKSRLNYAILLSGLLIGGLLTLLFFWRYRSNLKAKRTLVEKNKIIEEERERSDELLKNILPASIAEELKEVGKAKARKYQNATVMFSDFKNFTQISEQLSPEALVEELDMCFRGFDFIVSQYKLEKIKTIGDAYMVASGLTERRQMPLNIIKAALEMQEFLEDLKRTNIKKGRPYFEARIGIHSGPVVAGVVGINKFAYDIWGDTVNIAARMETNCEAGKINISEATYRLIKYNFDCQYRGKIQAKNKGQIDMYYVNKPVYKNGSVPA